MLTDALIRRTVGSESFRRGAVYAEQGRVSDVAYSQRHGSLSATVRGSGGRVYTTVAEFDDNEVRWWGECSCPVGMDCKHVAALLLTTQWALDGAARAARSAPARPSWERALGDLVGSGPTPPGRRGTPLGLQFEVEGAAPGRSATPDAPVRLRPVVPGAKGRWIRTGVSWRNLEYDYHGGRDAGAGRRAACPVPGARGRAGPLRLLGGGDVPVRLADFGPALWPALQEVVDAGVTLVTAAGAPVRLAGEPATLAVDVREAGDGGLLVEAVADVGEVPVPAEAVGLLGSPPHGAVLLSGVAGLPAGLVPDGGLL